MNAGQRRTDSRLWKYTVATVVKDFDHYVEMWQWLSDQHGRRGDRCGWREARGNRVYGEWQHRKLNWQFTKETDAIEFALRWA